MLRKARKSAIYANWRKKLSGFSAARPVSGCGGHSFGAQLLLSTSKCLIADRNYYSAEPHRRTLPAKRAILLRTKNMRVTSRLTQSLPYTADSLNSLISFGTHWYAYFVRHFTVAKSNCQLCTSTVFFPHFKTFLHNGNDVTGQRLSHRCSMKSALWMKFDFGSLVCLECIPFPLWLTFHTKKKLSILFSV